MPSFVKPITAIHYARWLILRPEQYLQYSKVPGVEYVDDEPTTRETLGRGLHHTPKAFDIYREEAEPGREPSSADTNAAARQEPPRFLSWLLFVVEFDGDLISYVRHVIQTIHEDVDRIWGNCYEYPGARDFDSFWLYARRHQINTDALYAAYPTLTVPAIHQLRTFKDGFDDFVARTRKQDGSSRDDIGPLLDEFLRAQPTFPRPAAPMTTCKASAPGGD